MKTHTLNQEMMKVVRDCADCHDVCLETSDYCLTRGGVFAEPAFGRLVADCAQICVVAADFATRGSEFLPQTAALAVEICDRCADACETLGDAQLVECAEACRTASHACREIVEAGDTPF